MLSATEAKACGGIARQIRGLLQGIDKLPEAFEHAEGLPALIAEKEQRLDRTERTLADREKRLTEVDAAVLKREQDYASIDAKYAAREAAEEKRLESLLLDIKNAEQKKADIMQAIEAVQDKFSILIKGEHHG